MPPEIDLSLLRAFVAAADGGGFSQAARRLNRTQSALSMQIKRLESQLGQVLFERSERPPRLTLQGERLLGYAHDLLSLNDAAMQAFAEPEPGGHVRLAVMEDYACCFLPALLGRFLSAYPNVHVEVSTGLTAHLLNDLGKLHDIVVAMHPADVWREGRGAAATTLLRREQPRWAAAQRYAAASDRPLPLALYPQGCLFRQWAQAALDGAGRRWQMVLMSPSLETVAGAVAEGWAVSVFKESTFPVRLASLSSAEGFPDLPSADIVLHRSPKARGGPAALLADLIAETWSAPNLAQAAP
ncbi:LysR family transcriptional regulator [Pelagibius litoralis]|uniref:LysR family transcriptional regulator n=1 Tax=Pelagibius litoralis TaxID=374515 RepID=A0A967F2N9_9PROT|nr:LysR family transcriptional regulator [Pelagibius litoralis]NIA71903.1 LysR family transcriptional regulator [Pelagibius litoralis]